MIITLIHVLIVALILCVFWYVVHLVATHLGAPSIAVQLIGLILLLVFVLYVLRVSGIVVERIGWHAIT